MAGTPRFDTTRAVVVVASAIGTFFSTAAHANCARPTGYDVTVAGNTVTVCSQSFQNRGCPDADGLLRENTTSGKVVRVSERCDSAGCYVDECVPKGSYRYGFAKPYDCCTACCGTDYFEVADVTTDPTSGCTPRDGGAAVPFTGTLPWKTGQSICSYQGGEGGPGTAGAAGSAGTPSGASGGATSAAGAKGGGTAGTTSAAGMTSTAGSGNSGAAGASKGSGGASASQDAGTASSATPKSGDDGGCGCKVGGPTASRTVFAVDGVLAVLGLTLLWRKRRSAA